MELTMEAAVVEQFGRPLAIHEWDVPSPDAGQILVMTEPCGVCQTEAKFGGYTKNGGFAQYVLADPNYVAHIPAGLKAPDAAPTLGIMALGIWLPYSPLASSLGLTRLPRTYWPILMATLLCYLGTTQLIKVWLLRKNWI